MDGWPPPKLKPDAPVVVLLLGLNPPNPDVVVGAKDGADDNAGVAVGAAAGVELGAVVPVVVGFPNENPPVPNPAAAVAPTAGNADTAGVGVGVLFGPPAAAVAVAPCCPKPPKLNAGWVAVVAPVAPPLDGAVFPN